MSYVDFDVLLLDGEVAVWMRVNDEAQEVGQSMMEKEGQLYYLLTYILEIINRNKVVWSYK